MREPGQSSARSGFDTLGRMKTRNVTDLVYFDDDAARTEILYETPRLFSQVICLQEAQGVGPMSDATSDGLVVVLAGEVAAQVGKERARMAQWQSAPVPAGEDLTLRNASPDPRWCCWSSRRRRREPRQALGPLAMMSERSPRWARPISTRMMGA